ncbi:MAG: MFS transporter [Gammaproteobacteria bacterium]
MGLRQSMGLFQTPMALEIGVSASAFGFALALQNLVWGASQPFVGMLADRFGARPTLFGASLVYALGLLLMGQAQGTLGLNFGGGLLVGLGVAGTGFGVLMAVVTRAVPEHRRSQMVGAVAAAGSLGTIVLAPMAQWMIATAGWRGAVLVFAAIAAGMAVLSLAVSTTTASDVAQADTRGDEALGTVLKQALTHPGYLAMTAAFFACGFQLVFITTHLPAFLAYCGIGPSVSASALGVIGLANAVGTYVIGLLGGRYSQKRLLALIYLLRTITIVAWLALPITPTSTLIFAAAMGLLWLGVAPLVSGIIGRMFGLKYFSTLYGLVFFSHQLGSFAGALLGGIAFDLTGNYVLAWASLIAIGLLAFALQWPMDDRPPSRRREGAETVSRAGAATAA